MAGNIIDQVELPTPSGADGATELKYRSAVPETSESHTHRLVEFDKSRKGGSPRRNIVLNQAYEKWKVKLENDSKAMEKRETGIKFPQAALTFCESTQSLRP